MKTMRMGTSGIYFEDGGKRERDDSLLFVLNKYKDGVVVNRDEKDCMWKFYYFILVFGY